MYIPRRLYLIYRRVADALGLRTLHIHNGPLAGRTLSVRRSLRPTAYAAGSYEPAIASALARYARPGMVAFDVGAHFGYFTLLLAERVAHVHAFEPSPANFRALQRTLRLNYIVNVTAHQLAVTATTGTASLEIMRASSMYRLAGNTRTIYRKGPIPAVGALPVLTTSLDHFARRAGLAHVDMIKLDIEGEELNALRGMQGIVQRWRPVLVLEVHTQLAGGEHPDQVLDLLQQWGYICRDLNAGGAPITAFAHTWSEHHVLAQQQ